MSDISQPKSDKSNKEILEENEVHVEQLIKFYPNYETFRYQGKIGSTLIFKGKSKFCDVIDILIV